MEKITNLTMAIKFIIALYHEGMINEATYRTVMKRYGAAEA